jgi:hypothetical protein
VTEVQNWPRRDTDLHEYLAVRGTAGSTLLNVAMGPGDRSGGANISLGIETAGETGPFGAGSKLATK